MTKVIVVNSLRNGLGRTTVACLLATELADKGHKTLLIDNNYIYCDVANYLLVDPQYTIDDIKPFVEGKSLEKDTIKELTAKVTDTLYIIAGSKLDTLVNVLGAEEIKHMKEQSEGIYDYIIVDGRAGMTQQENIDMMDIVDNYVLVSQLNSNGKKNYSDQKDKLPQEVKEKLKGLFKKSFVVINRYSDDIDFDDTHFKKSFGASNIFKLYYSPKLINFCNGFKCKLESQNRKEVDNLIERITGEKIEGKVTNKFGIKLSQLKSKLGIF